jgi:hypothetical protein
MQLDPETETARMAAQFEAEALGEAQWCAGTYGTAMALACDLAARALERAAINLRNRKS